MYKLQLSSDLSGCPECWQNWIREFNERWSLGDTMHCDQQQELDHFKAANRELAKINAYLDGPIWDLCENLVFADEKAAVLFALRWA